MISVIIPVYNGETHLAETLTSVLDQSLPPDEVIVVDDGSTDRTPEVAAQFEGRIRYIRQENAGPATARNRGIQASHGDLLAFVDSDDLWEPHKLERQVAELNENPDAGLVFCHMTQFLSPELSPEAAANLRCDPRPQPATLISCLLARRSAFDQVGLLRDDCKVDFLDWYMRAQDCGIQSSMVAEALVRRRLHTSNFTLRNKEVRRDYLAVMKSSIDRRRAAQRAEPAPAHKIA